MYNVWNNNCKWLLNACVLGQCLTSDLSWHLIKTWLSNLLNVMLVNLSVENGEHYSTGIHWAGRFSVQIFCISRASLDAILLRGMHSDNYKSQHVYTDKKRRDTLKNVSCIAITLYSNCGRVERGNILL